MNDGIQRSYIELADLTPELIAKTSKMGLADVNAIRGTGGAYTELWVHAGRAYSHQESIERKDMPTKIVRISNPG